MMRSGNPALQGSVFARAPAFGGAEAMTIGGTVNRTLFLLVLTVAGALAGWYYPSAFQPYLIILVLAGLAVVIMTIIKKRWAVLTGPLYALLEGVILGVISLLFESQYPGIVVQAVFLSFGVLAVMLIVYRLRIIRVTPGFRLGVIAATGAIFLVYLVNLLLSLFGRPLPFILGGGGVAGILVSLFVVTIAAFNLVLDFDFIERGAEAGAPRYMEWYGAFGLIVTLVWLYLEVIRLLARSRR